MFCALSGEAAVHPVVSKKSGVVFEKSLVTKALEGGSAGGLRDPVTGEEVLAEDLVEVVDNKAVKPRPPTLNSIPSLLLTLQNEWDATVLESYTLKQKYHQCQQELSNALFENDAAKRVIGRLIQERDEARAALAQFQASAAARPGGQPVRAASPPSSPSSRRQAARPASPTSASASAMDMDVVTPAPSSPKSRKVAAKLEAILQAMDRKAAELSSARKQRKMPDAHITVAEVPSFTQRQEIKSIHGAKAFGAVTVASMGSAPLFGESRDWALLGGKDGSAVLLDVEAGKALASVKAHAKRIHDVAWARPESGHAGEFYTASADSTIKCWKVSMLGASGEGEVAIDSFHTLDHHADEVRALSVHPTGDYLLSASLDATWALADIAHGEMIYQVKGSHAFSAASVHPDGLIFGTGNAESVVQVWDLKSRASVCSFTGHVGGEIKQVAFSENGYYLATSAAGDRVVKVWDLRKLANIHDIPLPEADEGSVTSMAWDLSAQFLAISSSSSHLRFYLNKKWTLLGEVGPLPWAGGAGIQDFALGRHGRTIVACGGDKKLSLLGLA